MTAGHETKPPPGDARWVGRFFPNGCIDLFGSFEPLGRLYPLKCRYLPTRPVLDAVRRRFGPCAEPVLRSWLDTWRAAVGDVDAYSVRQRLPPLGPEDPSEATPVDGDPNPAFVRPASFHALEDAVSLVEALRAGVPFLLRAGNGYFVRKPGARRLAKAKAGAIPVDAGRDRTTPYWTLDAFRERAGRGMAIAGLAEELVDILLDMSAQGHDRAFLKANRSKAGTWIVDIPAGGPDAVAAALLSAMGAHWTEFEENPKIDLLVQGFTPFVREHRFFVVRHRVVASTASDRMLGALDARPGILDDRVALLDAPANAQGVYDRGGASHPVDRGLVARMAWGARDLARALARGGIPTDAYVVDMGETADGRILPIEINALSQAGAYALNLARLMAALRRRADASGNTGWDVADPRPLPFLNPREAERLAAERTRHLLHGGSPHLADLFNQRRIEAAGRKRRPEPPRVDPSSDPALRRRWIRFLARSAQNGIVRDSDRATRLAIDGVLPFEVWLHPTPDGIAAALREADLGLKWCAVPLDGPFAPVQGMPFVGTRLVLAVEASEIDWGASSGEEGLILGLGFPFTLRPDASARVLSVRTGRSSGDGRPDIRIGDIVAMRPSERFDPLAIVTGSPGAMRAIAAAHRPLRNVPTARSLIARDADEIVRALMDAGHGPGAWDRVGARFAERHAAETAEPPPEGLHDLVAGILDLELELYLDVLGRVTLRVEEGPDGRRLVNPTSDDLPEGSYVTVKEADIDYGASIAKVIEGRAAPRSVAGVETDPDDFSPRAHEVLVRPGAPLTPFTVPPLPPL